VLRLSEAGCGVDELAALFLTHVHGDHVIDLPDVVMARGPLGTLTTVEITARRGGS